MKKLILIVFCFSLFNAKATTWNVNVSNFQFSPSTLNVVVGDIIHFAWANGNHTTTSSSVPAGATTFDALMTLSNPSFDYTVTTIGTYVYFCKVHGAAIMSGSFVATNVLAVALSDFSVKSQNNKPLLSWATQTENNAAYFSISRSIDGINFKEIGKVPAAGNSLSVKKYSFTDETTADGISYVYYTLATIDEDGRKQLSPIKLYKNTKALRKLIISLSPNPIDNGMNHLMLQFNADKTGVMIAKLSDMQGKIVLQTELSAEQGINNGHIHLGSIPAGIYTISFSMNGISESYRVVKN